MFGKNETPSVGIIDSQSVKTTQKGDPEDMMLKKKIKGRKRHIVVDTVGLIIAADVHSASVQDRDGALNLFTQAKYKAPTLRKFFADQGYIAKPLFIGDRIRLPRKLLMLQDFSTIWTTI
ncbi:MAG: transposase [Wolbachia endosymbiont of Andrena praecox]|nr:transposase [Wolbachia endosymbiont of Andrena praecox]MDX5497573.1 transposase [Wolbachia endosymbiont of Lasioglossum nitidulum]MDX5509896.1 transposase [Wolbachia endosymbiont of Lasioglossum morio]MDX5543269.1 transposase [Wolbachia endosymbiont of Andrena apicata]MDX5561698.1 transposase [Wolbachia endosymbiont of Andrena bicolor]MDX5596362.1 transposase [Wolbachia endosymbiont of Andrena labialis]